MSKIVTFGEIMWRLTTPQSLRFSQANSLDTCLGGSEANVAVSLAQMGLNVSFVTCLPKNHLAQTAIDQLDQLGVETSQILRNGDRMGTYFLESGGSLRATKVVYDRKYSSMYQSSPGLIDWDAVFEGVSWYHWSGITPAISDGAAKLCLEGIEVAKSKGITISVDLNMRKQMWKWGKLPIDVMPDMVKCCDIILGNGEAFEEMLGVNVQDTDDKGACEKVHDAYPDSKKIAFTKREIIQFDHHQWQGFLWSEGDLYSSRQYDIGNIVDRIGTGDAFMAALIYGMNRLEDDQAIINYATAGGAYKHSIKGDFNLASVEEIQSLMAGNSVRINR